MPLTEKEAAALERLEAEKDRRVTEKLERGEAVRGPVVVVGAEASIDAERERLVARLRATGEVREIVFPQFERDERGELREAISVIITGVRRAARDPNYPLPDVPPSPAPSVCDRQTPRPSEPRAVTDKTPPRENKAEAPIWRYLWATLEQPTERNPQGVGVDGSYAVINGTVVVKDAAGGQLGCVPIGPLDNAEAVARRILKDKHPAAKNSFYRPIYH
jgi:hypothetical protein